MSISRMPNGIPIGRALLLPGEGAGDVRKIVAELFVIYNGYYSIEPTWKLFHNTDVDSNDERRMQNFVSYGKRFEKILAEV